MDAINKILDSEGLSGLYSGIAGSLLGVASTNFAYFYWYTIVRTIYMASDKVPKPPGTAAELSLGAVAGAVAQIFTIPVAVITTRQQTQPKEDKRGFWETGKEVVDSEDGVSGLWRGLKASLILVVNPAITYGAYQRLKDILFAGKNNLKPWEAFRKLNILLPMHVHSLTESSSRCAIKVAGNHCNTAFDCCQSWSSVPSSPGREGKPFKSFSEVIRYILDKEGPIGLFKGIGPQITKGLLVQGLLMMTKERYVSFEVHLLRHFANSM